jgi:hypothetical protein
MPPKRPRDQNQLARLIMNLATEEASEKRPNPSPARAGLIAGNLKRAPSCEQKSGATWRPATFAASQSA